MLGAVVRLLSKASAVHACFVYLVEDGGSRLVMRAASEPYGHLVGHIALERGEGLAWWAIEHREPAFIREDALSDPRFKYVPELGEEKFQSLVSAPIVGRTAPAIGAVSLHTEAPREFTEAEVDFLVSSASLDGGRDRERPPLRGDPARVGRAGAPDGARRGRSPGPRRSTSCCRLSQPVAVELLGAPACHLYLLDSGSEELRPARVGSAERRRHARRLTLAGLGPEIARSGRHASVATPLVAGDELLGLLTRGRHEREIDLARTVASQTAVAIKKIELIERLTEKNLIKDFFEQLAAAAPFRDVEGRAARLRLRSRRALRRAGRRSAHDSLEQACSRASRRGSLFDRRDDSMRALVRMSAQAGEEALAGRPAADPAPSSTPA